MDSRDVCCVGDRGKRSISRTSTFSRLKRSLRSNTSESNRPPTPAPSSTHFDSESGSDTASSISSSLWCGLRRQRR
ncbi:hypothetical protein PAXRUDRAFT_835088 [Paxillus rubicundulus Ve08.2h10]|uniref:Uncharacterized protein n=1 Tax=Paxillus rubicundulus Ve08.2h10 TaxID=930991 RepID=A0A0D0C1Q5_9AGAM|nr:hypothetical protein PAXRUDRAFT_835088 [Paxillus rubicundulus Ve08.2h10]